MECSLKSCRKPVNAETGRVDVRAFQVTDDQRKGLLASWSSDGFATFHAECWRKLVNAWRDKEKDMALGELEMSLVKEASKTPEFHDPDPFLEQEAKRIAQMIRNADYPVFFTGAGISTAAGIGDFRGIHGKWTDRDKQNEHGAKGKRTDKNRKSLRDLRPTYTHEAIVKLLDMGLFKFVISQNTDGLHRLSGVPAAKISELHGNAYVQKCEKCEKRYDVSRSHRDMKSSEVKEIPIKKCERCHINHRTGRICEDKKCNGYLMNTIINFGDYLEDHVLDSAKENARKADIFVCLGSTLAVSPANSLVMMGKPPNRLVICNRQRTDYDSDCTRTDDKGVPLGSRIHGDCDRLMGALMRELLGEEACKEWEEGRESRMTQYDALRV